MSQIGKKIVFLSILFLQSLFLYSQDDNYRAEIGIHAGGGVYFGDVNSVATPLLLLKNMKNIKPTVGAEFRYKFNRRIALLGGYDYALVKGDYNYLNGNNEQIEKINNSVHFFELWAEYNFFELNSNPYKRFSKQISPFIFAGIGNVLMSDFEKDTKKPISNFTLPFGVGVKFKLSERWNFNIKIVNRLLLSDNLEALPKWNNPKPLNSSNPMNNDMHTSVRIGFTYDFWEKECDCNQGSRSKLRR